MTWQSPPAVFFLLTLALPAPLAGQAPAAPDPLTELRAAKTVCLEVGQPLRGQYGRLVAADDDAKTTEEISHFEEIASRVLGYAGVETVEGEESSCGIKFVVSGSFEPLRFRNSQKIRGVQLKGRLYFYVADRSVAGRDFNGEANFLWGDERPEKEFERQFVAMDTAFRRPGSFVSELLGATVEVYGARALVSALADPDYAARLYAAALLGEIGDASAVDPLLAALGDESPSVRKAAAGALGQMGDARALPGLVAAVNDPSNWKGAGVGPELVIALARVDDPGVNDALAALLERPGAVDLASKELAKRGDPRGAAYFAAKLKEPNQRQREFASEHYEEMAESKSLPPVYVDIFLEALQDTSFTVLRNAIKALGKAGDARAIEPLAQLLDHRINSFRLDAAEALARLGDPRWRNGVHRALQERDQDPRVRTGADYSRRRGAEILAEFGDAGDLPLLEPLRQDDDGNVSHAAVVAISKIKARASAPPPER